MLNIIVGYFLFSVCAGEKLYANVVDNARVKRENFQQQPYTFAQQFNYRPYSETPERIKHLLQTQQVQEQLIHIPVHAGQQLQSSSTPAPKYQHVPLAQSIQYIPKVQYDQAPPEPTYKGIQSVQASPQHEFMLLHGQGPATQNAYTPHYKQPYSPQPAPNVIHRLVAPAPAQYQPQPQPVQSQYPKNLPPHIQKIIEFQRTFQG